ncbi:Uncharacterised protein [Chromobacterium violaceum]|uniref:Uncharacterized protein n=1 Tax=Chromobacterium violaceum TaxID=536 RepID=A0A3S4HP81_CHRVL|nr:Uncharacterised protein [Chromobacterium violaceum]
MASSPLWAATATAPAPVAAPSPFASLLQVILGLAVVLGAIVGVAWLFKRLSGGMLAARAVSASWAAPWSARRSGW